MALAWLYSEIQRPALERQQWQAAAAEIKATAEDLKDQRNQNTFIQAAPALEILEERFPGKILETSINAFEKGMEMIAAA